MKNLQKHDDEYKSIHVLKTMKRLTMRQAVKVLCSVKKLFKLSCLQRGEEKVHDVAMAWITININMIAKYNIRRH